METWNREELYTEVWDQPLVRLAPKYGISTVALGKVCAKLQIPLPRRGYWIKKEFGKPVEQLLLPEAKNLPVVDRLKFPQPKEPYPQGPRRYRRRHLKYQPTQNGSGLWPSSLATSHWTQISKGTLSSKSRNGF